VVSAVERSATVRFEWEFDRVPAVFAVGTVCHALRAGGLVAGTFSGGTAAGTA